MKTVFAALFAASLAGCTSAPIHQFVKADGTIASEQDMKACEHEYAKAVPGAGGYGVYVLGAAPPIVKRCMELRGYQYKGSGALSYQ